MNGYATAVDGPSVASAAGHGPSIPPRDVNDALLYTPLASVIPVPTGALPMPTLALPDISLFGSPAERQNATNALRMLNNEAARDHQSPLVRKYLGEISAQIGASPHTEFRFKSHLGSDGTPVNIAVRAGESDLVRHGGRFSQMVLGKSKAMYQWRSKSSASPQKASHSQAASHRAAPLKEFSAVVDLTEDEPEDATLPPPQTQPRTTIYQQPVRSHPQPPATPSSSSKSAHVPVTPTTTAPKPNGVLRLDSVCVSTPPNFARNSSISIMTPLTPTQSVQGVVIPSSQIDRSQYIPFDTRDLRDSFHQSKPLTGKNRKRKRLHSEDDDGAPLAAGIDHRAKADSVVRALQYLLDTIFEADDGLREGSTGSEYAKFFTASTLDSDSLCLSNAIQSKLDRGLKDAINVRRYSHIQVDDIIRLQKMSENTLKQAMFKNIMPSTDDSGSAMEDWLDNISFVDNGLKAARTVLRTMAGGREEKQIYSEDVLTSVLDLLKTLIEDSIVKMAEMRPGENAAGFRAAFVQRKILSGLLHELTGVVSLLAKFIAHEEVTETAQTALEGLALSVVFVENAGSDKDSLFGTQKVELFRVAAMDLLANIFARYPDQSNWILDSILLSLEKLPVNKINARQFKLLDGAKNIQLVSALIMRLIQTSGTYQSAHDRRRLPNEKDHASNVDEEPDPEREPGAVIECLLNICRPLNDKAIEHSEHMVSFLVNRALKSTKTGDEPYRNLLDLFTEDFLTVLGSPEWPAAEILLLALFKFMVSLLQDKDKPATAKTMALDLLGTMGGGVCDLIVHLRESHRVDDDGHEFIKNLNDLTERLLENGSSPGGTEVPTALEESLVSWEGPSRIAIERLIERRANDSSLTSSLGYCLTMWSHRVCALYRNMEEKDEEDHEDAMAELAQIASSLRTMMVDKEWEDDDFRLDLFSHQQVRQAYVLTVLTLPFPRYFDYILKRLMAACEDPQANLRSKALKSISHLIAKDKSLVQSSKLVAIIVRRTQDPSSLVRDSAIGLLSDCLNVKPSLEDIVCKAILERTADTGLQVRKRALKILKEMYLTTKHRKNKISIAIALVPRIKDPDNSVVDLAKKFIEEIWIAPFYPLLNDDDRDGEMAPKLKLLANEKVSIMIRVVQMDVASSVALGEVIKSLLHEDNKNSGRNFRVCRCMVTSMFDDLLEKHEDEERADRRNILTTLTVFAKANAKLFDPERLTQLQPYIENLSSNDDLYLFRNVIIVYRHTLPFLTHRYKDFLTEVMGGLLKNLQKLPNGELNEVVACMWTISGILQEPERLIRVAVSCLKNINERKGEKEFVNDMARKRLIRTMYILGQIAYHCDFQPEVTLWRARNPTWKGEFVADCLADTLVPFCNPEIAVSVRMVAIENLCFVCQQHPACFLSNQAVFEQVFREDNAELKRVVLSGLYGFLMSEERRSETAAEEAASTNKKNKKDKTEEPGRLTEVAYANNNDGITTGLGQNYFKTIISLALGDQDDYALQATEVLATIMRQGLIHPKEVVSALICLETSPYQPIRTIAALEHKTLHSKHETLVETGYITGVKDCFRFQKNILQDPSGIVIKRTEDGKITHTAKLEVLYDIIKSATRKVRKKFLQNLISTLSFDPPTLDVNLESCYHLDYARFIVENLCFLDYGTLDDVYQIVTHLERLVSGIGQHVEVDISKDIFKISLDKEEMTKEIKPEELNLHAAGAAVLHLLWQARSFLRKAYAITTPKCNDYVKAKGMGKEWNKGCARNPGVNTSTTIESFAETVRQLETDAGRMNQCREFVDMVKIDHEFQIAKSADDEQFDLSGGMDRDTPEDDDEDRRTPSTPGTVVSATTGKKKRKVTPSTPDRAAKKRKTAAKPRSKSKKSKSLEPDEEWL